MRKKNSPYSEEFRKEALNLLATSGKSKTELEEELGLTHGLLRKWELRYQVNHYRLKAVAFEGRLKLALPAQRPAQR